MTKVGVTAITDKNNLVWLYHRLNSDKYELYFGFNGSGEHSTRVNFTDYYNWHKAIMQLFLFANNFSVNENILTCFLA